MLIHVNAILDTTSISEESQEPGKNKILHIIYSSVSVGLCCPFIFICMFSCLRRHHGEELYHIIFFSVYFITLFFTV